MTIRYLGSALTAIVLTWSVATVAPAQAQTRDASLLLPEQSGPITVAGCLGRGGDKGDKYLLASPRLGPAASLPTDTCDATIDERALELEHAHRHGIDDSMLGRWIEVSGRLEKETSQDPGNFRELYVTSFQVAGVAPAQAWTRDASLLPPGESGVITVAGCLQRGGRNGDKYVLARPRLGPVANTPEERCSATVDERSIELEHERKGGMNESMLGRWVEVNGRLERETSNNPDSLREMHVRSFRMVPVIPPAIAAAPAPVPSLRFEPQPITPPADTTVRSEETAVATTGEVQTSLPHTASPLPTIGLLGLLSLAGGLVLHWYRSYERG